MAGGKEYEHANEGLRDGFWLEPAIVYYGAKHPKTMEEETFAPILRQPCFSSRTVRRQLMWKIYRRCYLRDA